MKTIRHFAFWPRRRATLPRALCALLLACATSAFAYTVYDGGKALRQNIMSGAPVGANGETYTDENGGKWQYLRANDALATSTIVFGKSVTSGYYRGIGGNSSRTGSPFIHVNTTGEVSWDGVTDGAEPAEPIDVDEFYIHPGDFASANHYIVLRFIVPEDGWYSAFVTAHDVNGAGSMNNQAGAEIRLLANNVRQASGVVRLENFNYGAENYLTRRFDFQMPVRRMAAGETIDFMVGANGAHNSDATGLKAFVTKEDEGRFYDAGLAMVNNVTNSSLNPFGTDALGMWYYSNMDTSAARNSGNWRSASPAEFLAWAPGKLTKALERLLIEYDRNEATRGFRRVDTEGEMLPFMCVNHSATNATYVAPQEIITHPFTNMTRWAMLRFRPTRSGLYSASIVLRDLNRLGGTSDGVMAYLLISEMGVTNRLVACESWASTAHFTFGPRLVAANEPIDIVISPHNDYYGDATGISAIFRREADVYDLGPSLAGLDWASATKPAHPFADARGDGMTWDIGTSTTLGGTFTTMPYAFKKVSNGNDYFGYGAASDGGLPRVMVATNRISNLYSGEEPDNVDFYKMVPNELWTHPNNSGNKCPVVRATVPSDGIYHARAYVRDISVNSGASVTGVQLDLLASGYVPAAGIVSIDGPWVNTYPRERVVDGDRLWLKAGAKLDAAIDPIGNHTSDGTGLSVCYVKVCDAGDTRVINVDITGGSDSVGRFSAHTGLGREGWSDWNKWNALRLDGAAASAECRSCFEADGATRRNATVTLTRDSGAAIASVGTSGASTLLNNYASSTDASDTYTFTISSLKKNEPYTLWLYSAKGSATGNAAFTVDGVTKNLEETWALQGTRMLTRFDVTSDANGVITGTFAAADANGGAFNGLTLVGDLPAYVATGAVIVIR